MKHFLFKFSFFLFLFPCNSIFADSLSLHVSIPCKAKLFTTDLTGNCYVALENNTLIKYNANGDSLSIFNEIKKGKISQIDANNPLRILVYYSDFNQIFILDNMLSKKNIIKLNAMGVFNSPCIANSIDGTIWVFDAATNSLLKIDDKLNIKSNTNLRNILSESIAPVYMIEQDRNLFIVDNSEGIYKFDLYGFYNTVYHFKTQEVQFVNGFFVYKNKNELVSYNTKTTLEQKIVLPYSEDILQARIERNKVYILRKNVLDIYNLVQY